MRMFLLETVRLAACMACIAALAFLILVLA